MSRGRVWLLLLGVYFGLQILLRCWASDTVELDESEQVLLAQVWGWGYGPQPPLYTWLQILSFDLLGIHVAALALLKNLLLATTYVFTYLSGRSLTRNSLGGVLAALSLLFIPQVVWESQRDLTHSVLATTLAAMTVYWFLQLIETKRTRCYLWVGLCAGLGLLSKYNYGLLLVGLLVAGLLNRESRSALLDVRFVITVLTIGIVTGPHFNWVLSHSNQAFAAAGKLSGEEEGGYFGRVSEGVGDLVAAVVIFLGPLLAAHVIAFRREVFTGLRARWRTGELLLARQMGVIVAGLLIGITLCQWTNLRERWFLPILIGAPVLLVSRVRVWPMSGVRVIAGIALAVAVVVLILVPGRVLFAAQLGGPNRLTAPFAEIADQMSLPPGDIICANRWIGGNLRLSYPDRTVIVPELKILLPLGVRPSVVVWEVGETPGPPPELAQFVGAVTGGTGRISAPNIVEAAHYQCPAVTMRLAWAEITPVAREVRNPRFESHSAFVEKRLVTHFRANRG